jgi:hypothetical protein
LFCYLFCSCQLASGVDNWYPEQSILGKSYTHTTHPYDPVGVEVLGKHFS